MKRYTILLGLLISATIAVSIFAQPVTTMVDTLSPQELENKTFTKTLYLGKSGGTGFPSVLIPRIEVRTDNSDAFTDLATIAFVRSNYNPSEDAARITFSRSGGGTEGNLDFYTQGVQPLARHLRIAYSGGVKIGGGTTFAQHGQLEFEPMPFTSLGLQDNFTIAACADCVYNSNPCTAGGSGAIAKRINNVWRCD